MVKAIKNKNLIVLLLAVLFISLAPMFFTSASAYALSQQKIYNAESLIAPRDFAVTKCGDGHHGDSYTPSIDIGCIGRGNAIEDALFGIIKFLSNGVGLVVIASIIWASVQYITAGGDPQSTANAIKRIRSSIIALLIFIFSYAILNYLVPGAILQ